MALEGKEFETKIGDFGAASVDLTDKGMLDISLSVQVDIIAELEKLALRSDNTIDDTIIATIKGMMGRV